MGGAVPGAHRLQRAAAGLGRAEREADGRQVVGRVGDAEEDTLVGPRECGLVAAHHDHRAPGAGRNRQTDRPQQQSGDLPAAPRAQDQRRRMEALVQQGGDRVVGQHLRRDRQVRVTAAGVFDGGRHGVLREHLLTGAARPLRRRSLVALPPGGVDDPQRQPAPCRLVHRPVQRTERGSRSVGPHGQRMLHRPHSLPAARRRGPYCHRRTVFRCAQGTTRQDGTRPRACGAPGAAGRGAMEGRHRRTEPSP